MSSNFLIRLTATRSGSTFMYFLNLIFRNSVLLLLLVLDPNLYSTKSVGGSYFIANLLTSISSISKESEQRSTKET